MAALVWDEVGTRYYEAGVSRGVFYKEDGSGVPWNGLTAVEEENTDSVEPLYFDGLKYADLVTLGDFQGRMRAFTYPDEFVEYEGVVDWKDGFGLADQPKTRFGLSYRTEINNDLNEQAYKIHLLYNVLAIPSTKVYQTLSLDVDPADFEWEISALPEEIAGFRPTAHVIIDSRKLDPYLLLDIEELLYGSATQDPVLPSLVGLITYVQKWGRLVITNNLDGTWTASSPVPGVIEMLDADTFQITTDTATYLDADTYEISSDDAQDIDL